MSTAGVPLCCSAQSLTLPCSSGAPMLAGTLPSAAPCALHSARKSWCTSTSTRVCGIRLPAWCQCGSIPVPPSACYGLHNESVETMLYLNGSLIAVSLGVRCGQT